MMAKAVGIACLLLVACGVDAAARCSGPSVQLFDNQTVERHITVDSGKPCRMRFGGSSGPMYSVEIPQRPTNGTVRIGEVHSVIYTSRRGFVGSDTFVYARVGLTKAGTPTTRSVRVSVTVTP